MILPHPNAITPIPLRKSPTSWHHLDSLTETNTISPPPPRKAHANGETEENLLKRRPDLNFPQVGQLWGISVLSFTLKPQVQTRVTQPLDSARFYFWQVCPHDRSLNFAYIHQFNCQI